MANIVDTPVTYFDGFATELDGKFQRLRHLTNHNGASGNYHEEILRVVLRNFLTKRYSVKTGFIYKDESRVSNQLDIMVIDEMCPAAYIFQEGDFAIVMPQAIVAVIEVKTTLDVTECETALENIESAKKLFRRPDKPLGIIVGYQSQYKGSSRMDNKKLSNRFKSDVAKRLKENDEQWAADAFIWLNDNFTALRYEPATKTICEGEYYHSFENPSGEYGWQLSVLLSMVVSSCGHKADATQSWRYGEELAGKYLHWGLMEVSDEGFKMGVGKINPLKEPPLPQD